MKSSSLNLGLVIRLEKQPLGFYFGRFVCAGIYCNVREILREIYKRNITFL